MLYKLQLAGISRRNKIQAEKKKKEVYSVNRDEKGKKLRKYKYISMMVKIHIFPNNNYCHVFPTVSTGIQHSQNVGIQL